jgi:hypothetical protein
MQWHMSPVMWVASPSSANTGRSIRFSCIHDNGSYPNSPRAFLRRADRKRHFKSCRPTRRQTSELSVVSSGTSHGGSVDTTTQSSGHASQLEVWETIRVMAVFFGLFCTRGRMAWTITGSFLRFLQSTLRAQPMNYPSA